MIEIVSFRKTINWKKIIIAIIIFIILLCIGLYFFLRGKKLAEPIINVSDTTLFVDNTNSISLNIPKKYNLSLVSSDDKHVLTLKSPENLYILISNESDFEGFDIYDIITKDRDSYIQKYENVSNISDIKQNSNYYSYSFDYNNSGRTYTLETIWLKTSNGYSIIDINYQKDIEKYNNITHDVLSSIKFIENENGEAS